MSTDNDLAASFYGSTPKASAPAPLAKTNEQSTADVFFGASAKPQAEPTTPAGARDADVQSDEQMANVMFKNGPIYESPKLAIQNAAVQEFLANPEEAAQIAADWEPAMRAFDLNSTEAQDLTELGVSLTINAPEPEVIEAWVGDAKSALRQDFGDRAGEALEAAQRLVSRDPAVKQWLNTTGLGNHPKFVRVAAIKAMALKSRGRL